MTEQSIPLLSEIRISGLKSIKDASVQLGPINILVGPNGGGKTNLLTALRMLGEIRDQRLAAFVAEHGGASNMLHYGPKTTPAMSIGFDLLADDGERLKYDATLCHSHGDRLLFGEEEVSDKDSSACWSRWMNAGPCPPHESAFLRDHEPLARRPGYVAADFIRGIQYYHFHDTSLSSPMRTNCSQADAQRLRWDGSNLAVWLYWISKCKDESHVANWTYFTGLVRMVAPFVDELIPRLVVPHMGEASAIRLYWRDKLGYQFDVNELSDGTLRAIAVFAALVQPYNVRPTLVVLDEPELGMHPSAIGLLGELIRSSSARSQVVVATQSSSLIDHFEPGEVLITEQFGGLSRFGRLELGELRDWLEEYSLSQLYDMNVLGGRL